MVLLSMEGYLSKQEQMLIWARSKGIFSSVDVRTWGLENYYITADRQMRKYAEIGIVRKLTDQEIDAMDLRKEGQARVAFWSTI